MLFYWFFVWCYWRKISSYSIGNCLENLKILSRKVIFYIRTDCINFFEFLVNRPKIFKIDVLSSQMLGLREFLNLFFFLRRVVKFYYPMRYLKKVLGWISCRLNFLLELWLYYKIKVFLFRLTVFVFFCTPLFCPSWRASLTWSWLAGVWIEVVFLCCGGSTCYCVRWENCCHHRLSSEQILSLLHSDFGEYREILDRVPW